MKFRFTIRDLFWLVLVAALAAGWWREHRDNEFYRQFHSDSVERQQQWQSEHPPMAQK
jgi:hypothetical protein